MKDPLFELLEDNGTHWNDDVSIGLLIVNKALNGHPAAQDSTIQHYIRMGCILRRWQSASFVTTHKITATEAETLIAAYNIVRRIDGNMSGSPSNKIISLLAGAYGRPSP